MTVNFWNLFNVAIGLRVAGNGVLRFSDFKIFCGCMPPDPPTDWRLWRSQTLPQPSKSSKFHVLHYVGHSALVTLELACPHPPPPTKNPGYGPGLAHFSGFKIRRVKASFCPRVDLPYPKPSFETNYIQIKLTDM